ncbi:hypothetical protein KBZ21_53380, partial [Streptomyces sp. A73]|nr:hypothetical protein [Streptomyces sp. A73]
LRLLVRLILGAELRQPVKDLAALRSATHRRNPLPLVLGQAGHLQHDLTFRRENPRLDQLHGGVGLLRHRR